MITWTGQGASNGVVDQQCDANNTGYLQWNLNIGGGNTIADGPTLSLSGTGSGTYTGTQSSTNANDYKFFTPYFTPDSSLVAQVNMDILTLSVDKHGKYNGGTWNLVISHGCSGQPPCTENCSSNASADLQVFKTASPAETVTYTWGIGKTVDNQTVDTSGDATFNYTVSVTHDSGTASGWTVSGDIFVSNPNVDAVNNVSVTDAIQNEPNADCVIQNGTPDNADPSGGTISGGTFEDYAYTCTYSAAPADAQQTNEADVSYPSQNLPDDGPLTGNTLPAQAPIDWSTADQNIVDGSVDVTDPLASGGDLGTVSYTDESPTTFTYPVTFSGDPAGTCTSHDNTATFTTSDSQTSDSAGQTVTDCVGADLTASKTATPSFDRTYTWGISKSVDKTKVDQSSGSVVFNYVVSVTHDSGTDGNWQVNGDITVNNPNDWEAVTASVSDAIDNGGSCSITGDSSKSIDASGSADFPYTCTFSSNPGSGTNTATVSWDGGYTPDSSTQAQASYDFGSVNPNIVGGTATITDPLYLLGAGTLGTVHYTDPSPTAFNYSNTVPVTANQCTTVNNTATIVETGQNDSKSVQVCGNVTGGLTMGYWQNKNGQAEIGSANQAALKTFLTGYNPFKDFVSGTAANYVTSVIKAANASGAAMNAMLKGQMLATALDVYFHHVGGSQKVDLTNIYGKGENASSAFGGSCKTVNDLLSIAAAASNSGGSSWYSQNKTTQGYAKDTFDSINNANAFAC